MKVSKSNIYKSHINPVLINIKNNQTVCSLLQYSLRLRLLFAKGMSYEIILI